MYTGYLFQELGDRNSSTCSTSVHHCRQSSGHRNHALSFGVSKIPNVGSQILVLGLGGNDDSQFFTLESLGKSMEIVWGDKHLLKARSCGVVEMNIHSSDGKERSFQFQSVL